MAKMGKRKLTVGCIAAAAVAAALLLFFFLPRRADRLMKLPETAQIDRLVLARDTVGSEDQGGSDLYDFTPIYETTDPELVQLAVHYLNNTKLRFTKFTGGMMAYSDEPGGGELYTIILSGQEQYTHFTLRPDGVVYIGSSAYKLWDSDMLPEYTSLFDDIMAAAEADDWGVELSTEKLSELQTLFDMPSWYAQAVAAPFSDRSPDLARMFYDGLSYDESGAPVYGGYVTPEDGEEWDWVKANVSGAAELDVSRLPRAGMYQVLQEVIYGPQPVPDGLAPEGWTYWDETDCWYFAHGDTGINAVTLLSGRMDGGGLGCLRFEDALGNICTIHVGLGQTEQDAGHLYLRSCETE